MSKRSDANTSGTKVYAQLLAEVLCTIQSTKEMEEFISDLLTPSERKDLWERWSIIDHLLKGHSQREIRDLLKVSISKVTRGSQEIQKGTGAFRRLWFRIYKKD
jgi:Trp operon repressor